MSWATRAKEELSNGREAVIYPKGNSMKPLVLSGQRVVLKPVLDSDDLAVGDIVLATVRGKDYLHLIKAIRDNQVQIGNNRGHINGWIGRDRVYGIKTSD